jgi:hypothetical protein
MSSVDYTPVLLAQVTDLQMRVTKQDAAIAALKAEVERLTGRSVNVSDATMRTSIPLRPQPPGRRPFNGDRPTGDRPSRDRPTGERSSGDRPERRRPMVAPSAPHPTMGLSDVLKSGEIVTIKVLTGKDSEGNPTNTTAVATFDGTDLTVTECDLVSSLVGTKSSKPGEILYKFIDELKNSGHIKRTFSIAPWKLCFVTRGGVEQSLEQLRSVVG